MSNKDTLFYRGNKSISVDFSESEISSDSSLIFLEKIERKHKRIKNFAKHLPDLRNPKLITYTRKQLKQRVYIRANALKLKQYLWINNHINH